jgi:hypothetical protein
MCVRVQLDEVSGFYFEFQEPYAPATNLASVFFPAPPLLSSTPSEMGWPLQRFLHDLHPNQFTKIVIQAHACSAC